MNSKKHKKTLKAKMIDKIYLIITAIIVQGSLIAFVYFLMGGLNITEKWMIFILFYLFYNAIIIYFAIIGRMVKKYRPIWISVLILILMTNVPWIAMLLLVLSGILPLPRYGWIYIVGMFILGFSTLIYYRVILKKLRKRQKAKKREEESQGF